MDDKITVIGIGKLGLCFALALEKQGYEVVGVDINPEYIDKLNDKSFITDGEGKIIYKHMGPLNKEIIYNEITPFLLEGF